jgi:hypothetical protein
MSDSIGRASGSGLPWGTQAGRTVESDRHRMGQAWLAPSRIDGTWHRVLDAMATGISDTR